MKEIRMVDLKTQYDKVKKDIDTAIEEVINSTAFIKGPQVKEFENELASYLNVKHVIGCANGTDALQVSLMALGLQPGDEVITPDFTFIATIEVIALLGLVPKLVDVDKDTFNIHTENIKKVITKKTRAIMPVHLFGQCANMDEILAIARENNLHVIEDTAQATGAVYGHINGKKNKAGTMGSVGCTSFFPSKNLGCYGDGGAIFTNNDEIAEKIRILINHGMKVRYYHDMIGVNSRLDTIQAAILKVKLAHLDKYNKARQAAAEYYDSALGDCKKIIIPARTAFSDHIFHQYTIRLKSTDRKHMQEYLASMGIPTMIYYPVPLHRQKAFLYLGLKDDDFPVTGELCETVLSLPMHTELDKEQLEYITSHVMKFVED
ncbi:MAG: DegT/DnrJ/EryC1/StrS family aminotransferase [Bacteroidales bacterium]